MLLGSLSWALPMIILIKTDILLGVPIIPDLINIHLVKEGDLNIGALENFHEYSANQYCANNVREKVLQRSEAIVFALEQINNRSDLLPNVTLGHVILDSCKKDTTALARSMYLIPDDRDQRVCNQCPDEQVDNGTGRSVQDTRSYNVVGVIGPAYSRQAVMVSSLLGIFHIPVMGTDTTSDELSDKSRYPYFMRLVPPDIHQTRAIMDLAAYFNWTYVSLLYGEGSYGENAARSIEKIAKERGIVEDLLNNRKARAVILFLEEHHMYAIFMELRKKEEKHSFIWIGSDSFGNLLEASVAPEVKEVAVGGLYLGFPLGVVPGFEDFYKRLTPWNRPEDPWLQLMWKQKFSCSFAHEPNRGLPPCTNFSSLSEVDYRVNWYLSKEVEGAYVYATALHLLIEDECPLAFIQKALLRKCVRGQRLIEYLKQVSIPGFADRLAFDDKGDLLGKYIVRHVKMESDDYIDVEIGDWNRKERTVNLNRSKLTWAVDVPLESDGNPDSVCSKPCGPKHFNLRQDLPCCWECRSCRLNEILSANQTRCEPCPSLTWPDEASATYCSAISPSFLNLSDADPIAIAFVACSVFTLCITLAVTTVFCKNRKHKLVKATSKELSYSMLAGLTLGALCPCLYTLRPSKWLCLFRAICFHMTAHLLYCPLAIRSVRIYRIFHAGKKGIMKPAFISATSQLLLMSIGMGGEVIALLTSELIWPTQASEKMPIPSEPYVELFCDQPLPGFLLPLSYNLTFIVVCAILGYLSRKLPQNFNESWYTFISVSTTLFMWVVLLPTYFTSFYASSKAILLGLCLLLNIIITLSGLFFPKVYAIYFVQEQDLKITTMATQVSVISTPAGNEN